jgi:type II secretory pathway pseudopilin PulG
MFKTILNKIKSVTGNSLAEFAVTTAMMATLAATAAPQFGSVGEGAKEKKTMNNIDKIIQAANNYYNQKLDEEGRGRFPGQIKYDEAVGNPPTYSTDSTVAAMLELFVEQTLVGLDDFEDTGLDQFVYVFSIEADDADAIQGDWQNTDTDVDYDVDGANDFKDLFGNNGMSSPFQDGAYAYLVIPGYGSGTNAQAPALVVCDIENPTQLSKTLIP